MATVTIFLLLRLLKEIDKEVKKHSYASRSEFIRELIWRYHAKELKQANKFYEPH